MPDNIGYQAPGIGDHEMQDGRNYGHVQLIIYHESKINLPELPEVETILRQLLEIYKAETIQLVKVRTPVLLKNQGVEEFCKTLRGKKIDALTRRGKYLIFHCQDVYPVFHLGMTGIFLKDIAETKFPQHIHVEMFFESGKRLYFQDMRKFGKIWLYNEYPVFSNIGVDPINDSLSLIDFRKMIKRQKKNIKLFLMDQSFIAGIGNIYASEILFEASISPQRKASELTSGEAGALYKAIFRILKSAIANFGTTYRDFRSISGESGKNQHFLKVYQRHGQDCCNCGRKIEKISLGNRSTFFCPNCQG